MSRKRSDRSNIFWLSYSDLMTSLFFIMLVLFTAGIVKIGKIYAELENCRKEVRELREKLNELSELREKENELQNKKNQEANATEQQLAKIKELNNSVKEIDDEYFEYDEQFKRHTLKGIEASFNKESYNIYDIEKEQLYKLFKAGQAIVQFMNSAKHKIPEAKYLLIVEGQSSKDDYQYNYELSYKRALALIQYWSSNGIEFDSLSNCEVLISGSGISSKFRVEPDVRGNKENQRFVIHIIPKPGIIE